MSEEPTPAPCAATASAGRVVIARAVLDDLLEHARVESPRECCGLLIGRPGHVEQSVRARNRARHATRYLIEPEDHFGALRRARSAGLAVVGFYHSHPSSPPIPSAVDRERAEYPGHTYVIVFPGAPPQPPEIRAFELQEDGNFRALALVPFP